MELYGDLLSKSEHGISFAVVSTSFKRLQVLGQYYDTRELRKLLYSQNAMLHAMPHTMLHATSPNAALRCLRRPGP